MITNSFTILLLLLFTLLVTNNHHINAQSVIPLGKCVNGSATYYTSTSGFMCGFENIPSNKWNNQIPALQGFAPDEPWMRMTNVIERASCGECFQITGPKASAVIMVIDLCPTKGNEDWCSGKSNLVTHSSHFDLVQSTSWNLVAGTYNNVFIPTYRKVACPIGNNGPLRAYIGKDSQEYWMSLLFYDYTVGIKDTIEIQNSGQTTWTSVTRASYNLFEVSAGGTPFKTPLKIRVTSIFDEVITMTLNTKPAQGVIIEADSNFKKFSSSGTAVDSVTSSCQMLPSLIIYSDKLDPYRNTLKPITGSDWKQTQLWSGTANYASTATTPYQGATAVWETTLNGYGGLTVGKDLKLNKNQIDSISFYIKAGSTIAANNLVWMWEEKESNLKFGQITTSWTKITIPVKNDTSVASQFGYFGFKNLQNNSVKFYINFMELKLDSSVVPDPVGSTGGGNNNGKTSSSTGTGGGGKPGASEGAIQSLSKGCLYIMLLLFITFIAF
ncbi:hypothetical protein ABK040_008273 [Willaertia magna]